MLQLLWLALGTAAQVLSQHTTSSSFLLVGSYTNGSPYADPIGLTILSDPFLTSVETSVANTTGVNPSYMATSADQQFLYLTNEADEGQVVALRLQYDHSGRLKIQRLNSVFTNSSGPVHLVVTKDNRFLIVGSYNNGSITVE
jgi:6-phosphogluconolactonase (cycloisomerase 2 family)